MAGRLIGTATGSVESGVSAAAAGERPAPCRAVRPGPRSGIMAPPSGARVRPGARTI
jgi:hypothetical protein